MFAFCSFSLSLTFVLRYAGFCYTNVVFRLSLCLLGLKLSLYLVRILYFVVVWILIRLQQSNQVHSTTCQDLLSCKYQIPSNFPCCNLQNMNMLIQWFFLYSTILCEMWLWIRVITKFPYSEQSYKGKVKTHNNIIRQNQSTWKESLRHDGQQLHQFQQNNHLWS